MRPYNMQIITAESGKKAIELLNPRDIDLVFMDHMMPEMDGVETVQKIRAINDEYYSNLPIIALTANAVNGVREFFLESGFNDFLAKPIEISSLDRILRNYLPKEYICAVSMTVRAGTENHRKELLLNEETTMFDPEKGLVYTGGDKETYREILELYVNKSVEKQQKIIDFFYRQDWKNYVIEVHSLKSTSMSVGAVKLSELAKELETAGKSGHYEIIQKKNDELIQMYGKVIEIIKNHLGFFPSVNTTLYNEELYEISFNDLADYLNRAKKACKTFDGDEMTKIANEVSAYSFKGNPLNKYFGKAAELTDEFEYEAALMEILRFDSEFGGGKNE